MDDELDIMAYEGDDELPGMPLERKKRTAFELIEDGIAESARQNALWKKQVVSIYDPHKAFEITRGHTEYLDSLAEEYGLDSAMMHTVLFRELCFKDALDFAADFYVGVLNDLDRLTPGDIRESACIPVKRNDSSTGLSQIFASTACEAIEHAANVGIESGIPRFSMDDPKERDELWTSLRKDESFNLRVMALVLVYKRDCALSAHPELKGDALVEKTMSLYNGSGEYGAEAMEQYYLFKRLRQTEDRK